MNSLESIRFGLLLLLFMLLPAAALAQDGRPNAADAQTFSGVLSIEWADPLPLGSAPEVPLYFLHTAGAETHQFFLDPLSPLTPAELLKFDKREVIVEIDDEGIMRSLAPHEPAMPSRTAGIATPTVSGEQRWVTIGCKFADRSVENRDVAYMQDMYRSTKPGLNHYWPEVSYGNITIRGEAFAWFDLPHPWSHYAGTKAQDTDIGPFIADCTAADAAIYFPDYDGIQMFFNDELAAGPFAIGPTRDLTLDGQTKSYGLTLSGPNGHENICTIMHEMGHTLGMVHSLIDRSFEYEYRVVWDVMGDSDYNCDAFNDPKFGCVGGVPLAHNLDLANWIPPYQIYTAEWPGPHTVTLERTSQPTASEHLLLKIPTGGDPNSYLTVEARQRVGYDEKLPGDAVIIHHVQYGYPTIVDTDGNYLTDDEGAMWRVGESYDDPKLGARVKVKSKTASGFIVEVTYPDLGEPNDTLAKAKHIGQVASWREPVSVAGNIVAASDVDFYQFELEDHNSNLRVEIQADVAGSRLDSRLALYYENNGSVELVSINDTYDHEQSNDSKIYLRGSEQGLYYVELISSDSQISGGSDYFYRMWAAADSDPYELNDAWWDAAPIGYGYKLYTGYISVPGDQDYYIFSGAAGDKITADVDAHSIGSEMDPVLALFDGEGRVLAGVDDVDGDPDPLLRYTLPADGRYILRVKEFRHGKIGGPYIKYHLSLCVENNSEPNDSAGKAIPIAYGEIRYCEKIDKSGDKDLFVFEGKAGDLARIEVIASDIGSVLEPQMTLYGLANDGSLVELASGVDQGWDSLDTMIVHELPADGKFYVLVNSGHPNNYGEEFIYNLALHLETDTNEPNDVATTATDLDYGTVIRSATIGAPGDEDYFRFYGAKGDEIAVHIDAEFIGSHLDAWIELLDKDQQLLEGGWYGYSDYGPHINFKLPANGAYYLRVLQSFEAPTGPDYYYNLWLNAQDKNEPNDGPSKAAATGYGRRHYGIIASSSDKDYFAFAGAAGDLLRAEIEASDRSSELDAQLFLYHQVDGKLVELAQEDDQGFAGLDPMLVFELPAGDTYFLLVRASNKPEDEWRENFYFLSVYKESDPNEPNDTYADATEIAYGGVIDDATIGVPGDVDTYYFSGRAGERMTASVDAQSRGALLEATLCLEDSNYVTLACSEGDAGIDPTLTAVLPQNGNYFLRVASSGPDELTGPSYSYRLNLGKQWTALLPGIMDGAPPEE